MFGFLDFLKVLPQASETETGDREAWLGRGVCVGGCCELDW